MDDTHMIDNVGDPLVLLFGTVAWMVLWLAPMLVFICACFYCISLPLRRQEKGRLFLDLLEAGANEGKSPESVVVSLARIGDTSTGRGVAKLAKYIEQGVPLKTALPNVPGILPPHICEMFMAGMKAGDFRKVLPACQQALKDGVSQTRGAANYLLVLIFIATPVAVTILSALEIFVLPKLMEVAQVMEATVPDALLFLMQHRLLLLFFQLVIPGVLWCAVFFYIGGPRMNLGGTGLVGRLWHRMHYAMPWRRARMQRDFSAMLAVLLDAGMPEGESLTLAAECTGNEVFRQRALRARKALEQGTKLPGAIEMIDDTGEFRWRLAHALQGHGGFFKAIAGWNEALDARAFQQEQSAAHLVTTAFVLVNGALVATIVFGIFGILISLIDQAML